MSTSTKISPEMMAAHLRESDNGAPETRPPAAVDWPLFDGADAWDFPPVEFAVDELLPLLGVVWVGGAPKRYKSLLLLALCLAIACRRTAFARRFAIRRWPRILYIAREDGGPRLQERRDDILAAWGVRPERLAIRFVIRPHLDLLDVAHIAWIRETCQREGITLVVLDTWTALSPGADPMAAKDQAALAATVVQLAEDIAGAVVVVDHSRKNRPDGQALSSADIFGPLQKWAAAEHIIMLEVTADPRRVETFIEGKDGDTRRLFLTVSPRGSGEEKFTFGGTVEEIADAQRALGDRNREAVLQAVASAGVPMTPTEVLAVVSQRGIGLQKDTVSKHLRALAGAGRLAVLGRGKGTRYRAMEPSSGNPSNVVENAYV